MILDLESGTWDSGFRIWGSGSVTWDLGIGIWVSECSLSSTKLDDLCKKNLEPGIQDSEFGIQKLGFRIWGLGFGICDLESGIWD